MSEFRFAALSDLHASFSPDAPLRLAAFLHAAKEEKAGLIAQLGDFAQPEGQNAGLLRAFDAFAGPKLHVLGNHDLKMNSLAEALRFYGLERGFYAFDFGGLRFIALNGSFIRHGGLTETYSRAKHSHLLPLAEYPVLPEEQIAFLREKLEESRLPVVILAHQSLCGGPFSRGLTNGREIMKLLLGFRARGREILACVNGHDHVFSRRSIGGLPFITLPSASYRFVGFEALPRARDFRPARALALRSRVPYALFRFKGGELHMEIRRAKLLPEG
ncbi:MAG: metallophosphoesterase [Christensenellaceae bacterium]|nr:metallophosphoesterase [Christensenellaceae bacterium]